MLVFKGYGDHRELHVLTHAYPTRRSSDLRQIEAAEDVEGEDSADGPLKLAIIGRPNAGKSTLINQLLGQERLITGPEAGITRDSISIDWEWQGRPVRLIDTAGRRRTTGGDGKRAGRRAGWERAGYEWWARV